MNLEALEAIEQAIPAGFTKEWTASGQTATVEGKGVREVLGMMPSELRVTSLRLWAYRNIAEGDHASVSLSIDRYSASLAVKSDRDPVTMRGIEESILDICRRHRALWQRILKGRNGLIVYVAGLLLCLTWPLLRLTAPDAARTPPVEVAFWPTLALGAIAMLAWLIPYTATPSVRIVLGGEKRPFLEWRQIATNFVVSLGAGFVLLFIGIALGKGCG